MFLLKKLYDYKLKNKKKKKKKYLKLKKKKKKIYFDNNILKSLTFCFEYRNISTADYY